MKESTPKKKMKKSTVIKLIAVLTIVVIFVPLALFVIEWEPTKPADEFVMPDTSNLTPFTFGEEIHQRVEGDKIQEFKLVKKNQNYALYMEMETLGIALTSLKTGETWYSIPAASELAVAGGRRNHMRAAIQIDYINKVTGSRHPKNTYADSIYFQPEGDEVGEPQFHITQTPEGDLRVIYIIGELRKDYIVPSALSVSEYEAMIETFTKARDEANAKGKEGEETAKKMSVFLMKMKDIFRYVDYAVWQKSITATEKVDFAEIMPSLANISEDTEPMYLLAKKSFWISKFQIESAEEMFVLCDYTREMRDEINERYGIQKKDADVFWVPLDYQLAEEGLRVSVNTEDVVYNEGRFDISNIEVLSYFGATTVEDEGYMLVPDGSGALINLNNKRNQFSEPARIPLYGYDWSRVTDSATDVRQLNIAKLEQGYLPVFGVKKETSSLMGIVESGDALATITADVSRVTDSSRQPNYIYPSFKFNDTDELKLWGQTITFRAYQMQRTKGKYQTLYSILPAESGTYSDMAAHYRTYLENQGVFENKSAGDAIPFNLELIGAMEDWNAFLGIQYKYLRALTSYEQAQEIIGKLADGGVQNMNVRLMGFSNNGLKNTNFSSMAPLGELGGESAYKTLIAFAKNKGVNIYPDAEMLRVYTEVLFDDYNPYNDISKQIGRANTMYYQYSPMDPLAYYHQAAILSPGRVTANAESLLKNNARFDYANISLGSMGSLLSADYNINRTLDRGMVAKVYQEAAAKFANDGYKVALSGGNSYMLPAANVIYNLPNKSSNYYVEDTTVPFYQMVIHGYISYSGESINQSGDPQTSFLEAVEFGAGLAYRWSYESNEAVKNSYFEGIFSISYSAWIEKAKDYYERYNSELGHTAGQLMTSHVRHENNVAVTQYANGTKVYVNHSLTQQTVDGVSVPARDFVVVKGGN